MMRAASSRAPREAGVTLIELMVSVAIVGMVMAGVITAFLAQNRLFRSQSEVRDAQSSARTAMAVLTSHLRRAGYGIGPEFAVDFNWHGCDTGACARDNRAAGSGVRAGTDEIVVHARSLEYFTKPEGTPELVGGAWSPGPERLEGEAWRIASAGAGSVTLTGNTTARVLLPGRKLILVCRGGFTYGYGTVAGKTTVPAAGSVAVGLVAGDPDDAFQNQVALEQDCMDNGLARAFAVDTFRFLVRDDAATGRPFLWLDRGVDANDDGLINEADQVPVAADIEDLQLAYILRNGTVWHDGSGATPPSAADTVLTPPCSAEISVAFYRSRAMAPCRNLDTQRTANHPGNIAQLRLTLVARTPTERKDTGSGAVVKRPEYQPGNFSVENHLRAGEPEDGFGRIRVTTVIDLPNLGARGIPLI